MNLKMLVFSKYKFLFKYKEIKFIKICNFYGNFEIYKNHCPLITILKKCYIYVYKKKIYDIFIYKGFLKCVCDKIIIVVL